jgi:hypothetical protein
MLCLQEINGDDFWLHKPDWEVSLENETTYCFAPMKNKQQAQFLKDIHDFQWNSGACKEVEKSVEVNSGYGASTAWLLQSFWHAYKGGKPFQISQTRRRWLYSTNNQSSWAYCETEDTRCYYLPISPCDRNETEGVKNEHQAARPGHAKEDQLRYHWLRHYTFRPRHQFRRKLFELRQSLHVKYPCTTLHVRRGDAGLPRPPYRRYAAVQEYIDTGHIQEGDNVLLLTDDESTIEEVNTHHPKYNWMYLERPRNNGIAGGFDGHIPSGDEGFELLAIETELQVASSCQKVVYGLSGFMKALMETMDLEGRNYTKYYLNTAVSKEEARKFESKEARVQSFFKDIERKTASTEPDSKAAFSSANPLACTNTSEGTECCGSWDVDGDKFWLHNPDWEVSLENETTYCFAPMKNQEKAEFFREVYAQQWTLANCSEVITSTQINSGFGASSTWLAEVFMKALQKGKPFQIATPKHPWLYGPRDKSSWAYCETEDITCYYLPVSVCPRESTEQERVWHRPRGKRQWLEWHWLQSFIKRPKQITRHKLFEKRLSMNLKLPCTTMHVRRGDAGMPRQPYRRYAAVQEYLDLAKIEEGANIVLLTDDQTTIDEIHEYHQNYNWIYYDRPRNSGVEGGWESHIPSGDGAAEILAIETEMAVASQCNRLVHGKSGFMKVLRGIMDMDGKNYTAYELNTSVSKVEAAKWSNNATARAEFFMKEMEEYRRKSNELKIKASSAASKH